MELVAFGKEVAQNVAEHAASYKLGQATLRHIDRALWVVEKCARWAVPPPLDQDDRPQPELVRPLPWVFFLALLVALRVARETASVVNLVFGKPPLRSADVVMYIQSKRRYIRTLKYQGSRALRARAARPTSRAPGRLQALLDMTLCFRRPEAYGNNNTTRVSNNDEVLVVKHGKPQPQNPDSVSGSMSSVASSAASMEKLIERMMGDLDAESDDDSSFTLTNAASVHSDSDSDTLENNTPNSTKSSQELNNEAKSPRSDVASSTPNKSDVANPAMSKDDVSSSKTDVAGSSPNKTEGDVASSTPSDFANTSPEKQKKVELSEPNIEHAIVTPKKEITKEDTQNFIKNERCSPKASPSKSSKIANGRTVGSNNKRKGTQSQRREVSTTNAEGQL